MRQGSLIPEATGAADDIPRGLDDEGDTTDGMFTGRSSEGVDDCTVASGMKKLRVRNRFANTTS